MSDFKFSCPACGQHLSGDSAYRGLQITCPVCQQTITVPGQASAARTAAAGPAGGGPPPLAYGSVGGTPPLPRPAQRPPTGPTRTSGLALASIICSVGSFIIIPLGFIPGIICGHMAKKRIARDPMLGGRGLAKAGLIIGYAGLGLTVLALVGFVAFFFLMGRQALMLTPQQGGPMPSGSSSRQVPSPPQSVPLNVPSQRPDSPLPALPESPAPTAPRSVPPPNFSMAGPDSSSIDAPPDGSGWTLNLGNAIIPVGAVSGRIHKRPFTAQAVTCEGGWLKFKQGTGFFADLEMSVVLFIQDPAELAGKTFNIRGREQFGSKPHIWMGWKDQESSPPQQKSWMENYALKLEFGQPSGGKLPGKIYLCVPDAEKSFIRGTFQMPIRK
jgi:uncharacterized protein DUF4190